MDNFEDHIKPIIDTFNANVESVNTLVNFDRVVLDYAIQSVEELSGRLEKAHGIVGNPRLTAEQTLTQLNNIRKHDSMRLQYEEIFNQGVVLLVSYLSSVLEDIFENSVAYSLSIGGNKNLLKEELKIPIHELKDRDFNLFSHVGQCLVISKSISFQDMKSIRRAFTQYFDTKIERDNICNNIILGQACRHVIVHSGAVVDMKLTKQVVNCVPRDLKPQLKENMKVQFQPDEIQVLAKSVLRFVESLVEDLRSTFEENGEAIDLVE